MVLLDEEAETYIKLILERYANNPIDPTFDHVIYPPVLQNHLPAVFIWSPLAKWNISLLCPIHDCSLQPGAWTSNVTSLHSSRGPRLVYCVKKNFLLIQQLYFCYGEKQHYYLSASQDILDLIPHSRWSSYLSLRKFHKSAYSRDLIEYVFSEIVNGVNFSKISESLAGFRSSEYHRNFSGSKPMKSNPLFNSPSSSGLKKAFLDFFRYNKDFYVNTKSVPKFSVEADHTFKVAKPIGGYSDEWRFTKNFNKLFIVLSEDDSIADWKLTNTVTQVEIRPLLEKVNTKSLEQGNDIRFVYSDLCCEWRNFYSSIFTTAEVKLDLFHACQRITKTLPNKNSLESRNFSKEFGLVFREDNDLDKVRCLPTPGKDKILLNLENFLSRKKFFLENLENSKKTSLMVEIEKMRKHISTGCVSDIPPGGGTESNERLHRLLNRSFLRGSTTLSPEVAEAVLSLIFYMHNSKTDIDDEYRPLLPLFHKPEDWLESRERDYKNIVDNTRNTTSICKLFCDILKFTRNTVNNIKYIKDLCKNRLFNGQHFLEFQSFHFHCASSDTDCHADNLQKNLESFGLVKERLESYDDALIMSVAVQLKHISLNNKEIFFKRLEELQIDCDDPVRVIATNLRRSFEVACRYRLWAELIQKIDSTQQKDDHSNSKNDATRLGSLAVDILSDILGISIVVISCKKLMDISLHSPRTHQLSKQPIFITYHCLSKGLFSSTIKKTHPSKAISDNVRCNCHSINTKDACGTNECTCFAMNTSCHKKCFCRNCGNRASTSAVSVVSSSRCSCGKNNPKPNPSCANEIGKRSSKCPCLKKRLPCGRNCICKGCSNEFGKRKAESTDLEVVPRKKRSDIIYKPLRTTDFLANQDISLGGPWSLVETACLASCYKIVSCIDDSFNVMKAFTIYNYICGLSSELEKYSIVLRNKTKSQIEAKIKHLQRSKNLQ